MRDQKVRLEQYRVGRASHVVRSAALVALLLASAAANAVAVRYAYDPLGRLTQAVFDNGTTTTTVSYSYDATGNRTSVSTTSP
jgi:YD repeat-containing protein